MAPKGYKFSLEHNIKISKALKGKKNRLKYKDGISKSPEYHIWLDMKTRCYNIKNKSYKWYGARGIKICDEWKNDFIAFYKWLNSSKGIGLRVSNELSIDRINNDGNYEPGNLRWSTLSQQAFNRRKH